MLQYYVEVTPNARKSEVVKVNSKTLKVKVSVPAVEGKANKALIKTLADYFGVSKSKVLILAGVVNRKKRIGIVND